jgi:AbrB family looped-hinge helix DNA binding protein
MIIGKVGGKGRIVIPKEIRERFNIKPGDTIAFKIIEGKVFIEKIIEKRMKDILKSGKPVEPSVEFQRKLREEWEKESL